MPRAPGFAPVVHSMRGGIFSHLAHRIAALRGEVYPLHVGDTWMEPVEGCRMEDLRRSPSIPGMHRYAPPQGTLRSSTRRGAATSRTGSRHDARRRAGDGRRHGRARRRRRRDPRAGRRGAAARALLAADQGHRARRSTACRSRCRSSARADSPEARSSEAVLEHVPSPPRTVALYLNTPNNPTGRVIPRAWIEALVDVGARGTRSGSSPTRSTRTTSTRARTPGCRAAGARAHLRRAFVLQGLRHGRQPLRLRRRPARRDGRAAQGRDAQLLRHADRLAARGAYVLERHGRRVGRGRARAVPTRERRRTPPRASASSRPRAARSSSSTSPSTSSRGASAASSRTASTTASSSRPGRASGPTTHARPALLHRGAARRGPARRGGPRQAPRALNRGLFPRPPRSR